MRPKRIECVIDGKTVVRWQVRWYENGRGTPRRSRRFDTKALAEQFITEYRRRRQSGEPDYSAQTFAELAQDWWERYAIPNLSSRTQDDYSVVLDAHVIPRLGHLRLREIRTETIDDFRAQLERAGVGRSTVRRSMVVTQGILTRGVKWGRLPFNVAKASEKPSGKRQKAVVPMAPSSVEMVRAQLSPGYAALVSVLAYAGLRPQEALALEWRHVRVRTLLVEQKNVDGEIVDRQKTTRPPRTVDLLPPVRQDLAAWRIALGGAGDDLLVFPNADGDPWPLHSWRNFTRRVWDRAVSEWACPTCDHRQDALGAPTAPHCARGHRKTRLALKQRLAPHPTPYTLRHSFASLRIYEGMSIVELADQLGHSPQMTLSTYAHVFSEFKGSERIDATEQILAARAAINDQQEAI